MTEPPNASRRSPQRPKCANPHRSKPVPSVPRRPPWRHRSWWKAPRHRPQRLPPKAARCPRSSLRAAPGRARADRRRLGPAVGQLGCRPHRASPRRDRRRAEVGARAARAPGSGRARRRPAGAGRDAPRPRFAVAALRASRRGTAAACSVSATRSPEKRRRQAPFFYACSLSMSRAQASPGSVGRTGRRIPSLPPSLQISEKSTLGRLGNAGGPFRRRRACGARAQLRMGDALWGRRRLDARGHQLARLRQRQALGATGGVPQCMRTRVPLTTALGQLFSTCAARFHASAACAASSRSSASWASASQARR
jgi:hypothetical protein